MWSTPSTIARRKMPAYVIGLHHPPSLRRGCLLMWSPIHHLFVSSTHACHSTYPVISKGAERGRRENGGPQKQNTSSYLAVLSTEEQRRREKVAEGYRGFLKTEMHLNSDLFSVSVRGKVLTARRRKQTRGSTHLPLCSHLLLLRRKKTGTVEEGKKERKEESRGQGRGKES